MDELEARLKQDARDIRASTSPELRARMDASLHAARESKSKTNAPAAPASVLWRISSVTGLAAGILVILLMNWDKPAEQEAPDIQAGNHAPPHAVSLPEDWQIDELLLLKVEPADLTRSLEQELTNLQSDLEKARENVEREVKFVF